MIDPEESDPGAASSGHDSADVADLDAAATGLDPLSGSRQSADPDRSALESSPLDPDELRSSEPGELPSSEPDELSSSEPGELLFSEPGGSWWVAAIGPVLIAAILTMEILGPGQVHWAVILIFGLIIIGFSVIQVIAARRHVSVFLTETTLRQGTQEVALSDIATIYPANHGAQAQTWESARALGELHGVPRRRKGIGVKLTDGTLAQAWARDGERFRRELTEAHMAVQLGLGPRGRSD